MILWRFVHQELLGERIKEERIVQERMLVHLKWRESQVLSPLIHWDKAYNPSYYFMVTSSPIMEGNLQLNMRMCCGSHFELQTYECNFCVHFLKLWEEHKREDIHPLYLHSFILGMSNDGCELGGRMGALGAAAGRAAREPSDSSLLLVESQLYVPATKYTFISLSQECKLSLLTFHKLHRMQFWSLGM